MHVARFAVSLIVVGSIAVYAAYHLGDERAPEVETAEHPSDERVPVDDRVAADEHVPVDDPGQVSAAKPQGSTRGEAVASGNEAKAAGMRPLEQLNEPSLMTELRDLADSDPELSVRLARAGNERFPDSDDTPERTWFLVKNLVNLRRFHEARAEARLMAERYPRTSWTDDVVRHLLVYPLDQPSREEKQRNATGQ